MPHSKAKPPNTHWTHWIVAPVTICTVLLLMNPVSTHRPEWLFPVGLPEISTDPKPCLVTFQPSSPSELARIMDAAWIIADSKYGVPNVAPASMPRGMRHLTVPEKKRAFLRGLLPHVLQANEALREDRRKVQEIRARLRSGTMESADRETLSRLSEAYRIGADNDRARFPDPAALVDELTNRVDVVPPSLVLAQAAIESAWGASRFAREGNNLFGQWVFSSKGIIPLERPKGANYSLARFDHVGESVRAYLRNVNTFWAYEDFRALRRRMRNSGRPLDSLRLADGLRMYSTRRDEYVRDVRRVIKSNQLTRYDERRLAGVCDTLWDDVVKRIQTAAAPQAAPPDV